MYVHAYTTIHTYTPTYIQIWRLCCFDGFSEDTYVYINVRTSVHTYIHIHLYIYISIFGSFIVLIVSARMILVYSSLLRCNYCVDCEPGTYGKNCEEDCGHCKERKPCDIKDGHCTTGCETWYTSAICKRYVGK